MKAKKIYVKINGGNLKEISQNYYFDILSFIQYGCKNGLLIVKDNNGLDTSIELEWKVVKTTLPDLIYRDSQGFLIDAYLDMRV